MDFHKIRLCSQFSTPIFSTYPMSHCMRLSSPGILQAFGLPAFPPKVPFDDSAPRQHLRAAGGLYRRGLGSPQSPKPWLMRPLGRTVCHFSGGSFAGFRFVGRFSPAGFRTLRDEGTFQKMGLTHQVPLRFWVKRQPQCFCHGSATHGDQT